MSSGWIFLFKHNARIPNYTFTRSTLTFDSIPPNILNTNRNSEYYNNNTYIYLLYYRVERRD